jgi:transcriptional regulator with PAS, ATPase and Fis domain
MPLALNQSTPDGPFGALIGESEALQNLIQLIQKVGRSDISVLLQGESGTGKELVARAIYAIRSEGPFVPIDCSAMPANLVESELFGHERGAFTGAQTARKGLLEAADGGTAFFDEVGELPADAQAKLLRVLQQQELRPIGSNVSRRCSFRVIAATNRILAEEVENHNFRLDLYYRLNVVTLELPPLRERHGDIPILMKYFLRNTGREYKYEPGLMECMLAHRWPGNVRELKNCMARLITLTSDEYLHAEHLPFQPLPAPCPAARRRPVTAALSMSSAERVAIGRAMEFSEGNTTEAAKALGISRTTLYRRRKRFEREAAILRTLHHATTSQAQLPQSPGELQVG